MQVVASQLVTNNFTSTLRSASSGWRRVVFGRLDSGEQCRLCWSRFVSFEWGLIYVYLILCLCIVLMFMVRHDVKTTPHRTRKHSQRRGVWKTSGFFGSDNTSWHILTAERFHPTTKFVVSDVGIRLWEILYVLERFKYIWLLKSRWYVSWGLLPVASSWG